MENIYSMGTQAWRRWVTQHVSSKQGCYKYSSQLPEKIESGDLFIWDGTIYRGLADGESSLPPGTPWPIEGYKNYIATLYFNGVDIDVTNEIKNNVGQFSWNQQTNGQFGVLLPYLVKPNEVYIDKSYFVCFNESILGTVNIHIGNESNGYYSDIHFDMYNAGGDLDGSLLQSNQQYTCNFKFYPPKAI